MRFFLIIILLSYSFVSNCQFVPTPIFPTNNITLHDSIVNFEWNSDYSYLNQNIQISSDSNFTNIIIDDSTLYFPIYSSSILNYNTYYFWRVRGNHNSSHSAWSDSRKFIITTPKSLDSLQFWLDATQITDYNDGDSISITYDIGPDSFPLTQTNATKQPIFRQNIINSLSAIYFNNKGSTPPFYGDALTGGDILNRNGPFSFFAIAKLISPINYCTLFSKSRGYDGGMYLGADASTDKITLYSDSLYIGDNFTRFGNNFFIISFNAKSDSVYTYYNDTNYYSKINTTDLNVTSSNGFPFAIGGANYSLTYNWYGYISEIIINNDSLPDSTIKFYNKYLMDKYAPPICLGKDTSTCDTSLLINAYNNCYKSYLWQDSSTDSVFIATSSGYYYVDVIDVFGRHSSDTIYVNLDTNSFTVNLISDTTLCQGNNLFFNAGPSHLDYTWSNGITTPYLITDTSGTFYVTVTDCKSNTSTDSMHITFNNYNHFFNIDTILCFFDTLNLNPGFSPNLAYAWSTGDTTPFINAWNAGNYNVIISDTFGCKFYSDTAFVKVDSFPQTTTLGNDTSLCTGVNITLLSGNASATSYLWSTGDTTQYITINSPDNYSIIVTDTLGCIAKDTVQITIHGQAPIPNFTWQDICLGDSTQFANSSYTTDNSNIISWQWQLPDTSLTTQNVAFTFSDTGSFPVILVINTDSNCSNTIQKQVTIHSFPEAHFSTTQLCNNTPINFSENVTSLDSITSYYWNFGDSSSDSTANPIHQYSVTGNLEVSLNVVSLFGCEDSITTTLEIKSSPIIDFYHAVLCAGKQTQFTDLSTTSPIFPIINWQWDFGDNTSSTSNNPIHIYSDTGTFVVTLAAQSLNGCTQSKTDTIIVFPSQQTDYYADSLCANTSNQFIDSTMIIGDSIESWSWHINNSLQSTEQNPTFYFHDDGTYLISLMTQTTHQCKDSIFKYLTVFPAPPSNFSFYPEIGTPSYFLSFTADSNLNYFWDFGDAFTSIEQNPLHLFTDSGLFPVTLITTNNYGCHDTTEKTVLVVMPVYDVAIIDYSAIQTGNYLSFSCQFLNMGSLPLDSIELTLQIQDAPYFMEKWTGHILPGEVVSYQFSTNYQINGSAPEITCVEAKISGQTDPTPENNLKCNNSSDDFIFYTLYPNPTGNSLFLEFNNPKVQTVNIQIIDKLGKFVFSDKIEQTNKGFNRIKVNVSQFESGTYTVKIFTDIAKQEKQFMVY